MKRIAFPHCFFLALVGLLSACGGGEPAGPTQASERASALLPSLLDDTARSLEFLDEEDSVFQSVRSSMDSMNAAYPSAPFRLPGSDVIRNKATRVLRHAEGGPGDQIAHFLTEVVFTDANYEGDGVYRLRGADFCDADPITGVQDAQCVADFDRAELRVRATLGGDGLDLMLLVGPDRAEPIVVELRSDRITVRLDLGEAKDALAFLASVFDADPGLPTVMEGVVSATLRRNAVLDYSLSLSVLEAVRVEGTAPEGAYAIGTERKDPLFSVRAQTLAERLSVDLDVGHTTLRFPYETSPGVVDIDAGGVSGSIVLDDDVHELRFTNLGFGDRTTTVALDGERLFALDLNADSGRRTSLNIAPVAGALPTFAFDPELDLSLDFSLAPLAARGEEIESWLLDETYRIQLEGSTPTAQPLDPGGVRINSGTLTLSSTAASAPVVVATGQCLVEDELTAGEHPVLGWFAAAPCP